MNLKLLALLTIVFSLLIFCLAFVLELPVAYVPNEASFIEYAMYHILFISAEVATLSYLFMHMILKSNLEFDGNITKLLR